MSKVSAPSLANKIRENVLQARNLGPGDKLPTIRAMGQQFGVTPSRVLHAIIALEETGEVVRRHGSGCYVGTPRMLDGKSAKKTKVLSLLVPRHRRRSVVPALMEGLLSAAEDAGFTLQVRETGAFPDQEVAAVRRCVEGGSRVLILYPQEHRPPDGDPLLNDEPPLPMILVGDVQASPRLPRVGFDQEGCGMQMAQALREHGRRRVALWHVEDEAGRRLAPTAETRYKGLLRSNLLAHLPAWDICELSLRPDQQPDETVANAWVEKWLAADPAERPDCIWCLEDTRASLLQRAAMQRGVRIPQDLTICGADNLHGYHGIGPQDFPTTNPDYAKLARCVVRLAGDALDQSSGASTRYLLDLPVIWPSA